MKLFIILFFPLFISGFDFQVSDISSESDVLLSIPSTDYPQYVLVQNQLNDTVQTLLSNPDLPSSASWMGNFGYHILILEGSKKENKLRIKNLDKKNKGTRIRISINSLKDSSNNFIECIRKLSQASNTRYSNYISNTVTLEDKPEDLFLEAEQLFWKEGQFLLAAIAGFEAGEALRKVGENEKASIAFNKSINHWIKIGDHDYQVAKTKNQLGLALWKMQKLEMAIKEFEESKIIGEELNSHKLISDAIHNLGLIYWEKGEVLKAREIYFETLSMEGISIDFEKSSNEMLLKNAFKSNDLLGVATLINNIALTYDAVGDAKTAENAWLVYLELAKKIEDKTIEARAKNNLAMVLLNKGEFDRARILLEESISIFDSKNDAWVSLSLHNLGQLFIELGLYNSAEVQLLKALELRNETNFPRERAETLLKLFEVQIEQENLINNSQFIDEALTLGSRLHNPKILALGNYYKSKVRQLEKDLDSAQQYIDIAIKKSKDRVYKRLNSSFKLEKARIAYMRGQFGIAIDLLVAEVNSLKKIKDFDLMHEAKILLAQSHVKLNEFERAKEVIENQLFSLSKFMNLSGNYKVRSRFKEKLQESLNLHATISFSLGLIDYGLMVRNQYLAELGNNKISNSEFESNISEGLYEKLLTKSIALENASLSDSSRDSLEKEVIDLNTRLEFAYSGIESKKKNEVPLNVIQNNLHDSEVLIQFAVGNEEGVAWWIDKEKFIAVELPGKSELQELIQSSRKELSGNTRTSLQSTKKLSQILLKPLADFKNKERLILALDEPLNLIPLGALVDPRNKNKALASSTEIQRVHLVNTYFQSSESVDRNSYTSVVISDPVTDSKDRRVKTQKSTSFGQFPRLMGSNSEGISIAEKLKSKPVMGFDANRENILSSKIFEKDILHFSTHAFFNSNFPELSSLVLSLYNEKGEEQPGFLRAFEIKKMPLKADLVVLSACETGVDSIDGRGLEGLAESFFQAGANHLVASLWDVDDMVTSNLMSVFYDEYLKGAPVSSALSKAQRRVMQNPRTSHPKFWAGWYVVSNVNQNSQ